MEAAPAPVSIPAAVPDDRLELLPELLPEASSIPVISAPEDGQAPPTHPLNPPVGRHILLPNAVWQAGWMNGHPVFSGAEVPAGEYGPERRTERVIHLHDPNQLPPLLEAGQTLVIHLRNLPPDLYLPHVAVTGGTWGAPYRDLASRDSVEGRLLELRWNDKRIWRQDHAPFHSLVWGLVFPGEVLEGVNLFTLHNAGTRAVGLDAVWVEPLRPGEPPFGVVLRDGHWLNRSDSVWVRQARAEVPMPLALDRTFVLPPGKSRPPVTHTELKSRWEEASRRFQRLVDMEHPHADMLREWIPPIRDMVMRDIIPSVRLRTGHFRDQPDLEAAAYVFGDLIHGWAFSSGGGTPDAIRQLNTRIESPHILAGSRTECGLPNPMTLDAWSDFDYRYHAGRFRAMYFSGEITEANMLSGTTRQFLSLRFAPLLALQHRDRNFHTLDFHKSLIEGLMHSQHAAEARGGGPGGPFFPDGSDAGDHHWKLLKQVFRFGGPAHRKSHANLLPANPNLDLGSSLWAVADNGTDSVHVIIHNPVNRNRREAVLELPLPWSGPTRILHHRVATVWSRATDAEIVSDYLHQEATPFPPGIGTIAATPYRGWLRMGLTLEGMHLLEFAPADQPEAPRDIRAPASIGYGALRERNDLFAVHRSPAPPWWTRTPLIPHHPSHWRIFGPATLRVNTDATLGDTPDWRPLESLRSAGSGTFPGTSPLLDKSTFITFPEDVHSSRAFAYATLNNDVARASDRIGLWLRAHRPPGYQPPPASPGAAPVARFYLGHLPDRQKIEIAYDTWVFLSSPAEHWRRNEHGMPVRLMFQHDPATPQAPVLEIHSVDGYSLPGSLEARDGQPPFLGFARETESGKLAVLLVGPPGSPAAWRQRLDRLVDTSRLRHVIDEALVVSAESPDDPPPEEVLYRFTQIQSSRVLELEVEALSPKPSPALLEQIRVHFPRLADPLRDGTLGAVLWLEETE